MPRKRQGAVAPCTAAILAVIHKRCPRLNTGSSLRPGNDGAPGAHVCGMANLAVIHGRDAHDTLCAARLVIIAWVVTWVSSVVACRLGYAYTRRGCWFCYNLYGNWRL